MFYRTFLIHFNHTKLIKYLPIGHFIHFHDFTQKEIEDFYRQVGKNVKKIRKEKNISQMELALAIGHNSVGHVAKAELFTFDKHFNLEQLYKIAKVLDVSLYDLLPNEKPL